MLAGYKTYIVAIALIGYGIFGYISGNVADANEVVRLVLEGLGLAGLRAGVAKTGG